MSIRANVDARRLNERVQFQRNTPTQSASGEMTPSWAQVGPRRVCASVDGGMARGPEPETGGGIKSLRDYTVWVRSDIITRFNINVMDRIVWKEMTLNIKDIPDQQLRGRLMAVICNSGLNAG